MKIPFENPFKLITDLRPVGPKHCGGDPANLLVPKLRKIRKLQLRQEMG